MTKRKKQFIKGISKCIFYSNWNWQQLHSSQTKMVYITMYKIQKRAKQNDLYWHITSCRHNFKTSVRFYHASNHSASLQFNNRKNHSASLHELKVYSVPCIPYLYTSRKRLSNLYLIYERIIIFNNINSVLKLRCPEAVSPK